MNGKTTLTAILFFALGLYMGSFHLRPAPIAATPAPPSGLEKLQSLAEVDFEDYYRLKTMEEKFVKADEILGKIMVIFLADLGLRVSQQAQEAAQNKAVIPERGSEPSLPEHKAYPAPASVFPAQEAKKQDLNRLGRMEEKLLDIRDERAVEGLLRRVKLEDLEATLKSSTSFANRAGMLSAMNGSFEGRTNARFGGKHHAWYMRLELTGIMLKSQLGGTFKFRILENGKEISSSHNEGDKLDNVRELASDSKAVLARISPTMYLQLYYLKEIDQLGVNIYRRESEADRYELIGSSALKRAQ